MINRRTFLAYVRNKVAVGVLCSSMLSERLINQTGFTATEALNSLEDPAYKTLGMVTRGTFSELLRPELKKVFAEAYKDFPKEYPSNIFNEALRDGIQSEQTRSNKE